MDRGGVSVQRDQQTATSVVLRAGEYAIPRIQDVWLWEKAAKAMDAGAGWTHLRGLQWRLARALRAVWVRSAQSLVGGWGSRAVVEQATCLEAWI